MQADFRKAASIPRKGNLNPATHMIPEYEVLQLRTTLEKAHERLVIRMAGDLRDISAPGRFGKTFEQFSVFPADAQVVCLSFSYGLPAWPFNNLKDAVRWQDFEVKNLPSGRPTLQFHGVASQFADSLGVRNIALSITHTAVQAMAIVILES